MVLSSAPLIRVLLSGLKVTARIFADAGIERINFPVSRFHSLSVSFSVVGPYPFPLAKVLLSGLIANARTDHELAGKLYIRSPFNKFQTLTLLSQRIFSPSVQ